MVRPPTSSTMSWRAGSGKTRASHGSLAGSARLSDSATVGPNRTAKATMPTITAAETSHTRRRAARYRMSARASYAMHVHGARRARIARAPWPVLLRLVDRRRRLRHRVPDRRAHVPRLRRVCGAPARGVRLEQDDPVGSVRDVSRGERHPRPHPGLAHRSLWPARADPDRYDRLRRRLPALLAD